MYSHHIIHVDRCRVQVFDREVVALCRLVQVLAKGGDRITNIQSADHICKYQFSNTLLIPKTHLTLKFGFLCCISRSFCCLKVFIGARPK